MLPDCITCYSEFDPATSPDPQGAECAPCYAKHPAEYRARLEGRETMNQTAVDRATAGLVQPELPGTPEPSPTIRQRQVERSSRITKLISDASADLVTLAGQLDHWNAGRTANIHIPPEGIPGMLRNIAKEVNQALTLFYGPEHLKSFNRRLNGGRPPR